MRARILTARLPGWVDPAAAFVALHAHDDRAFWLDSGAGAVSGRSFLGSSERVVTGDGADATLADMVRTEARVLGGSARGVPIGWVGYLGYEYGRATPARPGERAPRHPDACLLWVDRLVAFDHAAGTVELVALGESWTGALGEWRRVVTARLLGAAPPAPPARPAAHRALWADTDAEYLREIAECRAAIAEGEAYQLCLTTAARVDGSFDPLGTYLALRASSPAHHGGLLRVDGMALLSASPERLLSVSTDGVVESSPIKGTRARGATPAEDERLRTELAGSEKERAENLMIVDLMRNDLQRVCEPGSVSVPALLEVRSYAHVHQLVSTVRGRLAAGRHPFDAVESCFPAGSMTGAPKSSAISILERLEGRRRGVYSGAFGYLGLDGSVDLAVIIRSIVLDAGGATVGAGGGITASSVPEEELAEVKLKAAALLAVLGA